MIIIYGELEKRKKENNPIRVGLIGAGFMGKGIALQIIGYSLGMKLVAISNRTLSKAEKAYTDAGIHEIEYANVQKDLDRALKYGKLCLTNNPDLLCDSKHIDIIVEATGAVEFSARVVTRAIQNKKHVILMNAELDATVGPYLKVLADANNVIISNSDGDQPGVIMNLYRFVKGIGVNPVLCGNIKGLHDPYRNPSTQAKFAKTWGQNPEMVTSFADGSKISFEQAVVANSTGMTVARRGMYGPEVPAGTPIEQAITAFPDELFHQPGGVVDYIIGASPSPGVFVIGTHDHPVQQHYLNLYKMGEGPYYCFYTPYHLCHFETPNTIARAVLFGDATTSPSGKPFVNVITKAKKNLKAGEEIDGIGKYMVYGVCENTATAISENLLPLGAAEECILKNDIEKDEAITYNDVIIPKGRFIDELLIRQKKYFNL
ncbi:Gfo/Idh/MocA family oxidoreductase [Cecembia sp.]|uniref:NAD(P)H-dependent oxidoreductase n=1 Tax=Cecembia sp. TaxID=1898110 RepID=UPI0025C2C866|nr:Gfo/Idh/MocA family oxidoreductase [Cecembia sp.]